MRKLIESVVKFWHQDVINKLIVLAISALVVGFILFSYFLLTIPQGNSLYSALFPKTEVIPTVVPAQVTATHVFTPTTAFFPSVTSSLPFAMFTPTPRPLMTGTSTPVLLSPAASMTPSSFPLAPCIPGNARQTGKVLDVLDGNTIKVYMEDKVYFVRYIGIQVPKYGEVQELYGQAAMLKNSSLVFGKEVSLIKDVSDKDSAGRLLRYILVGDTFVNLELLKAGFATAVGVPPDTACVQAFQDAEQSARQAQVGRWASAP